MKPAVITRVGGLLLGLVVFATAALAGDGDTPPKKKPSKPAQTAADSAKKQPVRSPYAQATTQGRKSPGTKVYSNEDLERMFGGGAPPRADPVSDADSPGEAEESQAKSPLEQVLEKERRAQERQQKIVDAEKKVAEAQQRIVDMERRVLASKNPLLARPAAPKEGREEWEQMDGAQRVSQAEAQLEAARQDLARAQEALAQLRSGGP